jgi:S-adenosylmethionine synthetase
MRTFLMTSESVTEGHPDKLCDQVSDAILDEALRQDPRSHVAVETMASKGNLMIAGEIGSSAKIDAVNIARGVMRDIGYVSEERGIDCDNCFIMTNINVQSPDIAQGVDRDTNGEEVIGGGDQGIMYGFACNETKNYMPLTIDLSHALTKRLATVRKEGVVPWLYPDGKAQVTIRYNSNYESLKIESVILSAQHHSSIHYDYLRSTLIDEVIEPVLAGMFDLSETAIKINPTGRFVIGGPAGDTGVTGRKIIVDTYGSIGRHGGGAFSGKDPTKVDRSAAYMARYVAKNIVAAGLADRCEVAIAYAIGQIEPEAVNVNTFGTQHVDRSIIESAVYNIFDFSVSGIIKKLDLRRPQYRKTTNYGHFGREDQGFAWEKLDAVEALRQEVLTKQYSSFMKGCEK